MAGYESESVDAGSIVRGCPCFKNSDGEQLCLNQDRISDVEYIQIQPELLLDDSVAKGLLNAKGTSICFQLLRIDKSTNKLVCLSSGHDLIIRDRLVNPADLIDAVEMLTGRSHRDHESICHECLYGVLDSFQIKSSQLKLL